MLRYTLFLLATLGSFATAIAAVAPGYQELETPASNVTIIDKNQAFPVLGPLIVEDCAKEDCTDVAS
jgi:hypothetical protein